jgi:hypothetical protein
LIARKGWFFIAFFAILHRLFSGVSMEHKDFAIGQTFLGSAGFKWLCTDKGTRTISAIMLDPDKDESWFVGPPYAVEEVIFDEHDMQSCYLSLKDSIMDSARELKESVHPGFDSKTMRKMFNTKHLVLEAKYPHKKMLRRVRVGTDGSIWHPYAARPLERPASEEGKFIPRKWMILVFELFSHQWSEIHEDEFVKLPYNTEEAMVARKHALELQKSKKD